MTEKEYTCSKCGKTITGDLAILSHGIMGCKAIKGTMTIFIVRKDNPDIVREYSNVIEINKTENGILYFAYMENGKRVDRVMSNVLSLESN